MTQNRKGFTLIELLIVVVIIGILAAIAIPKFANTKQKAYVATLKTDLRNLVTAEEAYFADNTTYTTALATTQFDPSQGVTYTVTSATRHGLGGDRDARRPRGRDAAGLSHCDRHRSDDGERERRRPVLPVISSGGAQMVSRASCGATAAGPRCLAT